MAKVVVAGKELVVSRATPGQIAGIANLLATMNLEAQRRVLQAGLEGNRNALVWSILGGMTEDRLVEFAALLIGEDKDFAREHFDLVWISEAFSALAVESNLQQVITNFTQGFVEAVSYGSPSELSEEGTDIPTSTS